MQMIARYLTFIGIGIWDMVALYHSCWSTWALIASAVALLTVGRRELWKIAQTRGSKR